MQRTPLLCGWMSVAMFSSLGLPGLNGFIGEFLIFKGSFALHGLVHRGRGARPAFYGDRFSARDAITLQRSARRKLQRLPGSRVEARSSSLFRSRSSCSRSASRRSSLFNIFNTTVVHMARLF